MKTFIISLFLLSIFSLNASSQEYVERYNFYFMSDIHWNSPNTKAIQHELTTGNGRLHLGAIFRWMNDDPLASFVTNVGDWDYHVDNTDSDQAWFISLVTDTLSLEMLPVIGNHEDLDAGYDNGEAFNAFINQFFPNYFVAYNDATKEGRTWFSTRPTLDGKEVNMVFFASNNVSNDEAPPPCTPGFRGYINENPSGYGWAANDYPGILDPNSIQRKDLRTAYNSVNDRDWFVVAGHRAIHGLINPTCSISSRPEVKGANDANGYIFEIDDYFNRLKKNFIVLQGDEHIIAYLDLINNHYAFSTTYSGAGPRIIEADSTYKKGKIIISSQTHDEKYNSGTGNYDTVSELYDWKSRLGTLESLALEPFFNASNGKEDWYEAARFVTKFEVDGTEMIAKLLLFESIQEVNGFFELVNEPTVVDSIRITQNGAVFAK